MRRRADLGSVGSSVRAVSSRVTATNAAALSILAAPLMLLSACATSSVTHDVGAALLGDGPLRAGSLVEPGADGSSNPQKAAAPVASFPVRLAVASLSGGSERQRASGRPWQGGGSSPELAAELTAIQALPQVADVAVLSQLALSPCDTMECVRQAAEDLQADIVLAWTLDTRSEIDDHDIGPFGLFTLGFAPNQEAIATVTASAVFIDVHSGFLYGVAEASAQRSKLGNSHNTDDLARDVVKDASASAIKAVQPELELAWRTIVARFGR